MNHFHSAVNVATEAVRYHATHNLPAEGLWSPDEWREIVSVALQAAVEEGHLVSLETWKQKRAS